MRTLVIVLVVVALLAGAVAAGYQPAVHYWQVQNVPKWRTEEVVEGDIISVVNSTGTVKPVLQVSVGSFVSGPIQALHVEFNQEVKKGDLMAEIDPRIYAANVARDRANLANQVADVERARAQLQLAINDEERANSLQDEEEKLGLRRGDFIPKAELDKVHFNRMALAAQLEVAKRSVEQAQAQLDLSLANLEYTKILAPVDGIVIDRKIDPGQTLAAQFQTPELFIVAPDMRKKMHVHASVDEADIGLINAAKLKGLPVTFTVDAYPDDLFKGVIAEIRLSSTTTQNVVTYPVVVAAPNTDLKLLPGMTTSISFEVDRRTKALKLPNSALRFYPQPRHVRKEDKPLVEGKAEKDDDEQQQDELGLSAEQRANARRKRSKRHVWVQDGIQLKAIEVQVGLSDSQHTELVSGPLKKGDKLIIGVQPPAGGWGG